MSQPNLPNLTLARDRVRLAGSPVEKLEIAMQTVASVPVVSSGARPAVFCPKCGTGLSVTTGQRSGKLLIYHGLGRDRCADQQKHIGEDDPEAKYRELRGQS